MVNFPKKTLLSLALMLLIDGVRIFACQADLIPAQQLSLAAKDLLPCQWTNETVSLHQSCLLSVQFNYSHCPTASNTSAWSSDNYSVGWKELHYRVDMDNHNNHLFVSCWVLLYLPACILVIIMIHNANFTPHSHFQQLPPSPPKIWIIAKFCESDNQNITSILYAYPSICTFQYEWIWYNIGHSYMRHSESEQVV